VQYRPILDEVRTVRERVGLFDLGHMGRLELRGPGAVALLDRLATNHVAKIPVGAIRYGLFCREDGDPIDDILVYRGQDHVFVVVNASNTDADIAWIREHMAGHDAQLIDRTDELGMIALQGPASERVLARIVEDFDLSTLKYYRFGFGRVAGRPDVRISRTGYTGEDGFEIYLPQSETRAVWDALLEAGAPDGIAPIGLGARDTLRLEAGMPLYGHEIGPGLDPVQAGLSFGVALTPEKRGTIGFDALSRIAKNPTRRLVGITTDGPRVPRQGCTLHEDGREIGFVCSGSVSPTVGAHIGSAYVMLGHDAPGTELELDLRGKRQSARVQDLPFYSRTRR
jgi:aminomethyltransferase